MNITYLKMLAEEIDILTHELRRLQVNDDAIMPSPTYQEKAVIREAKLECLLGYILMFED